MKYYYLFLLLLIGEMLPAQTEKVQTRILYDYDYQARNAYGDVQRADRMVLNTGKQVSSFLSLYKNEANLLRDSLLEKGYSANEVMSKSGRIPRSSLDFQIYKNYPAVGTCLYIDKLFTENYKYEEILEKPVWKMLNDKKEILGYSCQKATTNFRGRDWSAWFTTEIPVSEGPWKLWGLPGLILEAADADYHHHFIAIGVENVKSGVSIIVPENQYITCTREEFFKIRKNFWKDPSAYMERVIGGDFSIENALDHSSGKKAVIDYIDIETDLDKK